MSKTFAIAYIGQHRVHEPKLLYSEDQESILFETKEEAVEYITRVLGGEDAVEFYESYELNEQELDDYLSCTKSLET